MGELDRTTKTREKFRKIILLKISSRNRRYISLNSGVDYRGILNCLDGYMNIALEQTEYVNGQLKEKYDDAFIQVGAHLFYTLKQYF